MIDFAALIPVTGILAGVVIMWICYKYMELRVVGRKAVEDAAHEETAGGAAGRARADRHRPGDPDCGAD